MLRQRPPYTYSRSIFVVIGSSYRVGYRRLIFHRLELVVRKSLNSLCSQTKVVHSHPPVLSCRSSAVSFKSAACRWLRLPAAEADKNSHNDNKYICKCPRCDDVSAAVYTKTNPPTSGMRSAAATGATAATVQHN